MNLDFLCNDMHLSCMDLDSLILRLLEEQPIADQGDLLVRLAALGHDLTQSTLSRRLKRLGVQKIQGRYRRAEASAQSLPGASIIEVPPNLLVLRPCDGVETMECWAIALEHDTGPSALALSPHLKFLDDSLCEPDENAEVNQSLLEELLPIVRLAPRRALLITTPPAAPAPRKGARAAADDDEDATPAPPAVRGKRFPS